MKKEIENVKIGTINKPFADNIQGLKTMFIKGTKFVKEKISPKLARYGNKDSETNSNIQTSSIKNSEEVSTQKTNAASGSHHKNTISIDDDDHQTPPYNNAYYEETEEDDDNEEVNKEILTDNKKDIQMKINFDDYEKQEPDNSTPEPKRNTVEPKEVISYGLSYKKPYELSEDYDNVIHLMLQKGNQIDIGDFQIYPYSKFNKNKFIGFLTQSEQQMYAIIDENFMYQLEDKLINQQNKGLRQILKVLSLDLLIRILIYVRI